MSKPVKELIRKELISRFQGITSLAIAIGMAKPILSALANLEVVIPIN